MTTILKDGIDDTLLLKVVFAIIYIKNLCSTWALKELISPIEIERKDLLNKKLPNLQHFYVFDLTVYVFFYEKEYILKSAKWDNRALKEKLVEFDKNTIYKVYVEE